MILTRLKQMAEEFSEARSPTRSSRFPRTSTTARGRRPRTRGESRGLNVLRILNEPNRRRPGVRPPGGGTKRVAVYDLGGGTFDISILQIGEGVFEVKSTCGDTFLGGEDFGRADRGVAPEGVQDETAIDLSTDRLAMQRLKEAAEKAKCELSRELSAQIQLPFIAQDAAGRTTSCAPWTGRRWSRWSWS